MDVPRVDGLKVRTLIGRGGCGRVYLAEDETGAQVAVKVFDAMAIHRGLLVKMTARLEKGGWPAGVVPVISGDFESRPSLWVTPLLAEFATDGAVRPTSLQHRLDEHPGPDSWPVVIALARAIGSMHERRVAHGNLKPGNIFLRDDGSVQLVDWALGNMPGIQRFDFTDALLYQPPEQLTENTGYLDEAGYRWDVFAFGVLAYRLLTGSFPRCDETFGQVAPAAGNTRVENLHADLPKIARNLSNQPKTSWPDEAKNALEAGYREWIDRCLPLDPSARPVSMIEVAAGFQAVENKIHHDAERDALLDQRRRATRRASRSFFIAGVAVSAAIVLGGLWNLSASRLRNEKRTRKSEAARLLAAATAAENAKTNATVELARAKQEMEYERELALARLEASRLIGDRLFSWAMEKGHRSLPPLDGRELRLKRLERYFEDFLTRTSKIDSLADERARIRLNLAEISLAAGDAPSATRRLAEALEAWGDLPMDAELRFRMATNSLLLALLRQSISDPETEAAFVAARQSLGDIPQADIDAERLNQLLAILDFNEARLLAARGEDARALEQLMRATQTLNRLADQRPDVAILRSELAACYLSSATILDGMGSLGDAREVRTLAAGEIVKLLKERPEDPVLRLDLAGCYGSMAESAVLSGDIVNAESLSREALKLLDRLVAEQPDNAEAVSRKGAQLGLRAGLLRDRGQAAEAIRDFDEGIRMLEALRVSAPGNATATYRLALLWWQKGRMTGGVGNRNEEITFIRRARDLLGSLEAARSANGPRPEQLQSSVAYLLGDLGHALQLVNRREEAKQAFSDAVVLWENLLKSHPQNEEFDEGLSWCRQRLTDIE